MTLTKSSLGLTDTDLVLQLRERDGDLPPPGNKHGIAEACPYSERYPKRNCPWCRHVAGVVDIRNALAQHHTYAEVDLTVTAPRRSVAANIVNISVRAG